MRWVAMTRGGLKQGQSMRPEAVQPQGDSSEL